MSDIDNAELNNLAKCMGVLVHENNFATFDMLKDLESARNCLYAKHQKQTVSEKPSEIVECAVDKEVLTIEEIDEEESKLEEFVIQKSLIKDRPVKKKFTLSPRGRKQDQEDLGLLDSRNKCIPVNLNKRKKTKEKMVVQGLIWNCRGLKKRGVSTFLKNLKFHFIGLQETMTAECEDSLLRKFDVNQDYLWL